MSDNTLTTLMGYVPSRYVNPRLLWFDLDTYSALQLCRCIVLLEDLDAAFTRSVSRDATSTGAPTSSTTDSTAATTSESNNEGSTLSLSGLLNALDGVAAAEGR